MKKYHSIAALVLSLLVQVITGQPAKADDEWQLLSSTQSFDGWHQSGNWRIDGDGSYYRYRKGGSLVYTAQKVPDDFELRFDWKVSKGCNSGVYYRPGQVEFQILDNEGSAYSENARQAAGSLFFCMAPSEDATKAAGEWNTGRIVCHGSLIEHWINGTRILSFDYRDKRWAQYVELLAQRGGDLTGRGGNFKFQDHGQDVWYRNIRLKALDGGKPRKPDPSFKPMEVVGEALRKEELRVERMIQQRQEKASRPNIVWIVADDLGWGDIQVYAEESKIPTPRLNKFASEGVCFMDAHSPSTVCSPTRYGLLTGTDPVRRYQTSHVLFNGEALVIEQDEATIASVLRKAGYRTGIVGKWHLGLGDELPRSLESPGRGPKEIGFSQSFIVPDGHNMMPRYYVKNGVPQVPVGTTFPSRLQLQHRVGHKLLSHQADGNEWGDFRSDREIGQTLVDEANRFLDQSAEQEDPFFLLVTTCAIHTPFVPDAKFVGKSGFGEFGDYVMQFDWMIGQILDQLSRLNLAEDTWVVITSDNGGLPNSKKYGHDSNGPWRGYKGSAYEGGHRVPLMMRWPSRIAPATKSNALISLVDLPATAASVAGGLLPPHAFLDSIDQQAAIRNRDENVRQSLVVTTRGIGEVVLRSGDSKLIKQASSKVSRCFDLQENPAEVDGMLIESKERIQQLETQLSNYLKAGSSRSGSIGSPTDWSDLWRQKEQLIRERENLVNE